LKEGVIEGRGVYAILDVDAWRARGVDVTRGGVAEPIADALLVGGASTMQLRAKHEPARVVLDLLRRLAPRAKKAGVPLVANDRADLAVLARIDAVHVGRDDLPLADVRRIAPGLDVGTSTHDLSQLEEALADRPTYVAFGPVFATASKHRPDPTVGLDLLRRAASLAEAARTPLVAIGGITLDRAPALVEHGVRWAAVIGELVAVDARSAPALDVVAQRTRALSEALRSAVSQSASSSVPSSVPSPASSRGAS
jgi:thiamine-phosphate pyrophosphorylase